MDEMFDILDEAGRVIGTAPRRACHGNPALIHPAVHVFVFDGDGRLFLQQRSLRKDTQPGRWDTSVGGHPRPGEAAEEAARRETQEELGFSPAFLEPAHRYVWRSTFETEFIHTFVTRHDGPFAPDPEELADGRFWTFEEVEHSRGAGVFTPQFEHEWPRIRAWWEEHGSRALRHGDGRSPPL